MGVCVGGGQTSCPGFGLLPAGAGRRCVWTEFGTDGRTAAGDWQVRSGAGQFTLARPGGPRKEGSQYWLLGARAEFPPERTGKPPPLGTLAGSGGPGSGQSEAAGFGPFPLRDFEADVPAPLLGFWGRSTGTRPS